MPFWVKTVFLGQEVHYYMVYIAYFTELKSKIWDYAQKRRICCKNCNYALDENFHFHLGSRRKAAKFCDPTPWPKKWCAHVIGLFCLTKRSISSSKDEPGFRQGGGQRYSQRKWRGGRREDGLRTGADKKLATPDPRPHSHYWWNERHLRLAGKLNRVKSTLAAHSINQHAAYANSSR